MGTCYYLVCVELVHQITYDWNGISAMTYSYHSAVLTEAVKNFVFTNTFLLTEGLVVHTTTFNSVSQKEQKNNASRMPCSVHNTQKFWYEHYGWTTAVPVVNNSG